MKHDDDTVTISALYHDFRNPSDVQRLIEHTADMLEKGYKISTFEIIDEQYSQSPRRIIITMKR